MTGSHPPSERTLELIFHVLVPVVPWNWDNTCKMCMRFDHPSLGEWKGDIGEFKPKRFAF